MYDFTPLELYVSPFSVLKIWHSLDLWNFHTIPRKSKFFFFKNIS